MNFNDIMEYNAPYNEIVFNLLMEQMKKNNIVPFIGAGMSVLYDGIYPLWEAFLHDTFAFFKLKNKSDFDKLNYEEKADFLYSNIGNIMFGDHLKDVFGEHRLQQNTVEFKKKPAYLLPTLFKDNLLITTNYDKVIEKMYQLHNEIITVVHPSHNEELIRSLRENTLLLYKIHGDIAAPLSSIILTKEQYDKAYQDQNLIVALQEIFKQKMLLFLGCSLQNDRYLELLNNIIAPGYRNIGIISCRSDLLEDRRKYLENQYNTQVIIYPDGEHECLNILLNQMSNLLYKESIDKCSNTNSNELNIGHSVSGTKNRVGNITISSDARDVNASVDIGHEVQGNDNRIGGIKYVNN